MEDSARLAAIVRSAHVAIIGTTLDGTITDWNGAAERIFGYKAEEILGRTTSVLWPPDRVNEGKQVLKRVVQGEQVEQFETACTKKNGHKINVLLTVSPVRDTKEKIIGTSMVASDLTKRKQSEAERDRLATIVECSDDAIIGMTLDGIITSWNAGAERVFAYSVEEAIGQPIFMLIPLEDHDSARQIIKTLRRGRSLKQLDVLGRRKGGQCIDLSLTISPFKDLEGKVVGISSIARDISDKKATDEALQNAMIVARSANNAKSEFLAAISHEIRTPLNGVLGASDFLLTADLTPEKQREYIEMINNSGNTLLHLINEILDLSKIESGTIQLDDSDFDLKDLLDGVVASWDREARVKNLDLFVKVAPELPVRFKGDVDRLRQVLVNLVSNAVKFTEKGYIAIRVSKENPGEKSLLRFDVKDTGIGIDRESQARIFEAFEQVNGTETKEDGSVGLGLAISKKLILMMGGQIGVESKQGDGSTFWFTVPCNYASPVCHDAWAQKAKSGSASQHDVPSLRILVAEDDEYNLKLLVDILKMEGHSVDTVGTGVAALEAIRQETYNLVFMDIRMPEMDGLTATREIRSSSAEFNNIPIIAITASAMRGDKEKYLDAGMTDYISKPFMMNQVIAAIRRRTG